ncbi:RES family NAD+ phosphorylase [Pseudomonas sp. 910_23]|uniref:RES family NAD+ phosphorylase n=1 Tax=Pseudomonas sp. 910_23 TaxID=2604461 RepID=UPI004063773B
MRDIFCAFLEAEKIEATYICMECLADEWLRNKAASLMEPRACAICGSFVDKAQTPSKIASIIREPLQKHFIVDYGLHPGYEMSLSEVIQKTIGCPSVEICNSIAQKLVILDADDEEFYAEGQEYSRAPSPFESEDHCRWYVEGDWKAMSIQLIHGQRFFNDGVKTFFESLISEALWSNKGKEEGKPSAIKKLPVESVFYRARIAKNLSDVHRFRADPDVELGAPPKDHAANNRMSAAGIPLIYLSGDPETCIAEVRPSIGDEVVLAKFTSTEELLFFDFTALELLEHDPISLFSPKYEDRVQRRLLLTYLHDLIARPIRKGDTDYVMTQALAEYIRFSHHDFDGIAFRSVQRSGGGINYVLFDKGSVEKMHNPDWRPQFNLITSVQSVSVHKVTGVVYHCDSV